MEPLVGPWLLAELSDLTSTVSFPLQCTQRIKYTCFDVSKNLLIFGATSGGLYVFRRDPCSFLQLIPNKEGSIVRIKISPQEKCVAFATHKGYVCICDCGTDIGTYMKSPVLQISKEHQGNEVTAMIWNNSGNVLYIGDDTGTVSILNILKSFAKSVFQNLSSPLMHLDSRIVQLDVKESVLLVSTFSRCFICDTDKEQYFQIGQKLRDGEFGACFFYQTNDESTIEEVNGTNSQEISKSNNKYSILTENEQINCFEKLNYLKVFCARPSSRLWEVNINGTVTYTHQFKQLLAVSPTTIISCFNFENDTFDIAIQNERNEPQSVCFTKLYMLKNRFIFTFKKNGIYILDPKEPSVVLWSDRFSDIADCIIMNNIIYVWRLNGNLSILSFCTLEKFLLKCFLNQKFKLCAKICAVNSSSIMNSIPTSKKIHLLSGLGEKLNESGEKELYDNISPILEEINKQKKDIGQKSKSGIVIIENSFQVNAASGDCDTDSFQETDSVSKNSSDDNDSVLFQISPEAIQVIKDFSNTVTDKLSLGTKSLKKKWDHIEGKMKKMSMDKISNDSSNKKNINISNNKNELNLNSFSDNCSSSSSDKELSSKKYIDEHKKVNRDIEVIYLYIEQNKYNLLKTNKSVHSLFNTCDINVVYQIIKDVEQYLISLGSSPEYSIWQCSKLLLLYIDESSNLSETIDSVIQNEALCSYFLEAFISINSLRSSISSCSCGYPLPNINVQTPLFTNILNIFIEKKWESSQSEECYNICKKVPYMWKKILLLRKNEDLYNLLLLLLQMLDEELLYTFLPQFTVETWERAVKLLGTLRNHECLNCGNQFNSLQMDIIDNIIMNWDCIGALMIKSIGCINATRIFKLYSDFIPSIELSLKYYHSCVFLKMFQQYDGTINSNLIDTIYQAYEYEEAINEMCKHLQECLRSELLHTALPLIVAAKSTHWGLKVNYMNFEEFEKEDSDLLHQNNVKRTKNIYNIKMNFEQTLEFISDICPNTNCHHCCLLLTSRVLIIDGGLWVFSCGHTFHGICLKVLKVKLCPLCFKMK